MKIIRIKIEYESYDEYVKDRPKKLFESLSEISVIERKDGRVTVVWGI